LQKALEREQSVERETAERSGERAKSAAQILLTPNIKDDDDDDAMQY